MIATNALALGLKTCLPCGKLLPAAPLQSRCGRCGALVSARRPGSLERTTALTIAAALLYIPANVLPIMITTSLTGVEVDTILSGIFSLIDQGFWPLALIVFVASFAVPLLKLGALGVLLWTTWRRSTWRPRLRTRIYRGIEIVGRWSMLDVYAMAVLVALVEFGAFARVEPGAGVLPFGAVVVATMFATRAFDPRLMWDAFAPAAGSSMPASQETVG